MHMYVCIALGERARLRRVCMYSCACTICTYVHVRAWIRTYMYEDACTHMYVRIAVGERARLSICAI